jgi:hypothetical protein
MATSQMNGADRDSKLAVREDRPWATPKTAAEWYVLERRRRAVQEPLRVESIRVTKDGRVEMQCGNGHSDDIAGLTIQSDDIKGLGERALTTGTAWCIRNVADITADR